MERKLLALSTAAAILLAGCVVVPAPGRPAYYGEPVLVAPPPPRVEYIGTPPVTGYVWLSGYWNWSGGRHVWVPGRWEAPRRGHVWSPHRWEREGDHWRQHGGYWQKDGGHRPRDSGHGRRDQHWQGRPLAAEQASRIGLDTNVLTRYYVQDEADAEAEKQHEAARRLMESGQPLMVCKKVLFELEWVMRGYYEFSPSEISKVMNHIVFPPQVTVEDRDGIARALSNGEAGLELTDALHHASYRECDSVASFDDKTFVRRARRLGLAPRVIVP